MNLLRIGTDADIERLRTHQFVSAGSTILDRCMDPFWSAVELLIPRSVSPNLVSVVGGLCASTAGAAAVVASQLEVRSLYFLGPALLFVYITADAVDGKHARRTSQSTPLGSLVDHGIDAFVAFTTGVAVCSTADAKLSSSLLMTAYCLFHLSWFCAQWAELELDVLDQRGITEGEFATMLVLALPGLLGTDVMRWEIAFHEVHASLGGLLTAGVALGCGLVSLAFCAKVLAASQGRLLTASVPFLQMGLHCVLAISLSCTVLVASHPVLLYAVVGMDAVLLMTKVRIAATLRCQWRIASLDTLPFAGLAAACFAGFNVSSTQLVLALALQCLMLVSIWHDLITRVCRILDLPFLQSVPVKVS
mmetsp:Transcript_60433/g.112232  ORF Transcript_60433/g.112232 Transcript_60433/m.112232 type:complete len:363 (-) Transcript_60433:5-1093(-)